MKAKGHSLGAMRPHLPTPGILVCLAWIAAILACFPVALGAQEIVAGECRASGHPEFLNPPERSSEAGVLEATLRIAYKTGMVGPKKARLRAYQDEQLPEKRFVGPAYRLKAGDLLKIHLVNQLPRAALTTGEAYCQGDRNANCTNFHTHGFHVSPAGNSDNVLITIEPDRDFQNEIKLPSDHPPGTHWFHAHKHGSTAIQVSNGMSGALIVEGALDDWLAEWAEQWDAALEDQILILQQIPLDEDGEVEMFNAQVQLHGSSAGDSLPRTVINGLPVPVLRMRPGQIERWRFIHSGVSATVRLQVASADGEGVIPLHELAKDGIATGELEPRNDILLQPGYRSDVLFQAPVPEDDPARCRQYVIRDAATSASESLLQTAEPAEVIAIVQVAGTPVDWQLPASDEFARFRAYEPIDDDDLVDEVQEVWFNMSNGEFTINGESFENAETRRLVLGETQRWLLWSERGSHPFHIHVNPFEVIERDKTTGEIVSRYWKDTILISSDEYNSRENALEIRSRYERYIGGFVLHCHNLFHEDQGMMQRVEIVLPGDTSDAHHH